MEQSELEFQVIKGVKRAIAGAFEKQINEYNSPLKQLVTLAIEKNSDELIGLMGKCLSQVLRDFDFEKELTQEIRAKLARAIINESQGMFESKANELRRDKVFGAKLTLAVSNVIAECAVRGTEEVQP